MPDPGDEPMFGRGGVPGALLALLTLMFVIVTPGKCCHFANGSGCCCCPGLLFPKLDAAEILEIAFVDDADTVTGTDLGLTADSGARCAGDAPDVTYGAAAGCCMVTGTLIGVTDAGNLTPERGVAVTNGFSTGLPRTGKACIEEGGCLTSVEGDIVVVAGKTGFGVGLGVTVTVAVVLVVEMDAAEGLSKEGFAITPAGGVGVGGVGGTEVA